MKSASIEAWSDAIEKAKRAATTTADWLDVAREIREMAETIAINPEIVSVVTTTRDMTARADA